jgi:hypothetical protein
LSGIFTAGRRADPRTIVPSARSASPPPIAAALGITMLAALALATMSALPRIDKPIAVVGLSAGHAAIIGAIGEAGGSVLSVSGSNVVIAMAGDDSFVSRLRGLGYWFALDAKAFTGCGALFAALRQDNAVHSAISTKRGSHADQHA